MPIPSMSWASCEDCIIFKEQSGPERVRGAFSCWSVAEDLMQLTVLLSLQEYVAFGPLWHIAGVAVLPRPAILLFLHK